MTLPPELLNKYLSRFDELIYKGEEINRDSMHDGIRFLGEHFNNLISWKINCISLLEQVLPPGNIHRNLIKELQEIDPPNRVDYIYRAVLLKGISYLKSIKLDLGAGFLDDLTLAIEAEIAADYMGQAEQLLAEGQTGNYDHIPAAVLSGAVLEKSLRTLCGKQAPPVSTVNNKGFPLMLNSLIDELKKKGVFNELIAKQLRAWADIRNSAAHGDFAKFSRDDVGLMIYGINNFLVTYLA